MLTSKDNASVKIFFPSQGHFSEYYNQPLGSAAYQIKERGQSSRYHVSDSNSRNGIPLVSYVDVRTGNTSGAYYYSKPGQGANAGIQISRIKNQMPLKCIKY